VLPSWRAFTAEDPLGERAYEQMVLGVATRAQLEEFLSKPLEGVDLKVLMLDGLHFAEHAVLVALGIDSGGRKHLLGLADGATENAAACLALLASLGERGLRAERSLLVLVDGNKALPKAIREVFGGRALVQRCQVHKKGNVLDHLPKGMRGQISASLSQAYHGRDPERARRLLMGLARKLEADYPGAAASLREGLGETLTLMGMGLPVSLERTLSSTNVIENLPDTVRGVSRRVKRWRGEGMILRWMAAGLMEAGKGFRRVRGYPGMAHLGAALERNDERIDGRLKVEEGV
jgi:transposase-like protein